MCVVVALTVLRPDGVLVLGVSAAGIVRRSGSVRVLGRVLDPPENAPMSWTVATVNPSVVLPSRDRDRDRFVADLSVVADRLGR